MKLMQQERIPEMISVIVPVYNMEKYLDRCIESIVNQTYTNLEIFLVDDGSTDRSGEICDQWENKDSRIVSIHKKNGGLSDARNYGIISSHGEYISFIDSDDYIAPDFMEYLYNNRAEKGITICGYTQVWRKNLTREHKLINAQCNSEEAVSYLLSGDRGKADFQTFAWNKLYYYDLFHSFRYPVGKSYEDVAIIIDLLHAASEIHILKDSKYFYVMRSDSIVHQQKSIKNVLDLLEATNQQKERVDQYFPDDPNLKNLMNIKKLIAYCTLAKTIMVYNSDQKDNYASEINECKIFWNELKAKKIDIPTFLNIKMTLFLYFPWVARILLSLRGKFLHC